MEFAASVCLQRPGFPFIQSVPGNISSQDVSDTDLHEEIKRSELSSEETIFLLSKKTGAELLSS